LIHGICLCRNEASQDRWLEQYINQLKKICNSIIFLDDNSTDDTIKTIEDNIIINSELKNEKLTIIKNDTCLWESNEVIARKKLWNKVTSQCNHGDWIVNLDCDEILEEDKIDLVRETMYYLSKHTTNEIDSIGFKLYDMWNDTHYRDDMWWSGHTRYWPMIVRYDENKIYTWSNKKLHCGRFPLNAAKKMYPLNIRLKHMGWSKEKLRIEKYNRYMKIDGNKQDGLLEQYESILDKNPNLVKF
jgi:hypothetical protein